MAARETGRELVVAGIAIYVEGGGDTEATLSPFRKGMSEFFRRAREAVRARRITWRVIVCGGRQQAYEAFCDALANEASVFNVLLVDAEEPVAITAAPWKHLHDRPGDRWVQPPRADGARCQMMVACMEAWFLADPDGLSRHFKHHFDRRKLPRPEQAETRTVAQITDALKKATRNTKAREYEEIRDGAKLLALIDPAKVREHCKWCDRLFRTLGDAIGADV